MVSKTIKGIDEEVYDKFRSKCILLHISTGKAITEAMNMWLKKRRHLGGHGGVRTNE